MYGLHTHVNRIHELLGCYLGLLLHYKSHILCFCPLMLDHFLTLQVLGRHTVRTIKASGESLPVMQC